MNTSAAQWPRPCHPWPLEETTRSGASVMRCLARLCRNEKPPPQRETLKEAACRALATFAPGDAEAISLVGECIHEDYPQASIAALKALLLLVPSGDHHGLDTVAGALRHPDPDLQLREMATHVLERLAASPHAAGHIAGPTSSCFEGVWSGGTIRGSKIFWALRRRKLHGGHEGGRGHGASQFPHPPSHVFTLRTHLLAVPRCRACVRAKRVMPTVCDDQNCDDLITDVQLKGPSILSTLCVDKQGRQMNCWARLVHPELLRWDFGEEREGKDVMIFERVLKFDPRGLQDVAEKDSTAGLPTLSLAAMQTEEASGYPPEAAESAPELQVRHLRQQPAESSSSSSTGVMALGAAGVVVASAQAAKRTVRRAQVVRQATAVAEKTFTKIPASVKPGVVTGQALAQAALTHPDSSTFAVRAVLSRTVQENQFAIPGVNVVSSSSVNACMEAAKKAGGPVMVTFSKGGGQFLAGKAADNSDDAASIAGTIAGALHVRQVAKLYGVPVILHTDHCQKAWLPWFDGLIEASEEYFEKYGVVWESVARSIISLRVCEEKLGCDSDKPVSFVFHGGSGSSLEDIRYAIEAGVVKMNIDTDTQWAFWDGMNEYQKKNKDRRSEMSRLTIEDGSQDVDVE
eukprot:g14851.t1